MSNVVQMVTSVNNAAEEIENVSVEFEGAEGGWIKLFKNFLDWEWYNDNNVKVVFIHCLLKANFAETSWKGNKIERGQFITSIANLARETQLTSKQVRGVMQKLNSTGETASFGKAQHTVITVKNYNHYQAKGKQRANKGQAKGKPRANKGQQYKNIRIKEDKNIDTNVSLFSAIQKLFNESFPELPLVKVLNNDRKTKLKNISVNYTNFDKIETWQRFFKYLRECDFLMGKVNDFTMSFDWLVAPKNFLKAFEGNYTNKELSHD